MKGLTICFILLFSKLPSWAKVDHIRQNLSDQSDQSDQSDLSTISDSDPSEPSAIQTTVTMLPYFITPTRPLNGIDRQTYIDYLGPATTDFRTMVANDDIEMTAQCFFSLLINFLFANDQDLVHPSYRIWHEYSLETIVRNYGRADILIQSYEGNPNPSRAVIIEVKYFGRHWQKGKWENQMCSYLLGYRATTVRNVIAKGVLTNMVRTQHFTCVLDPNNLQCDCRYSQKYRLFGTNPQNRNWNRFDSQYLIGTYLPALKGLVMS